MMIEIYKTPSKEIQEVILANLTYETVIDGLNEYFASEPRNDYITVKMEIDKQDSELYAAEAWADILIEWLRKKHDIFYRPGMTLDQVEAARSAAKICCLRAHIKDEISKRGIWCDKDADIPELVDIVFRAYDEEEADLKKRTSEIKEVNDKRWKDLRDINKALGYDGMDGHVDDFAKAVKARAECAKMALGDESDINALIRDYCTKNDIMAPSRYLSDEACIEYLFSVIDLKQKDRSFTILQDLYRDIFKKQPDGLSAEDIANKILDRVLETEDLLHKSVDSVCDRSNIALRDIYTTVASPVERRRYNIDDCDGAIVDHMKEYILRRFEGLRANTEYCLKKMSELDGCQKDLKTLEEQRDEFMKQNAILAIKVDAKDDEISRLKDLINAMNEEVGDM